MTKETGGHYFKQNLDYQVPLINC